jgi:hypothetical protein
MKSESNFPNNCKVGGDSGDTRSPCSISYMIAQKECLFIQYELNYNKYWTLSK